LTKRVDRFVPRAALSSTRLKTLAGAVIDHDEDYCAALICHARSAVYSPHLIWLLRHDCSVVCARLRGWYAPSLSKQVTLTHDAQNAPKAKNKWIS
jgi:hypothetical protein